MKHLRATIRSRLRCDGDSALVFAGVTAGLVLGKPIGIVALSWLATRVGIAALPRGIRWLEANVAAGARRRVHLTRA